MGDNPIDPGVKSRAQIRFDLMCIAVDWHDISNTRQSDDDAFDELVPLLRRAIATRRAR